MKDNSKARIETVLVSTLKKNVDLQNEIYALKNEYSLKEKEFLIDFIQIIDTFERAEVIIKEKGWNQNDSCNHAITRLLTSKQRTLSILEKYNVTKMKFIDNLASDIHCKTIDTEPNPKYPNNYIISIEEDGYMIDNLVVLRKAEVIVVRN
jgi:molecular chaperone GrpE (heat shock protein)